MPDESDDVDINDAFDKILLAEDVAEKAAYEEGFNTGKKQGLQGYHLGYHAASSLAAQLGYYVGLLIHIQNFSNSSKIIEQSKKLMEDVKTFPFENDDTVDVFDKFETIKLSIKKICSLAKVDSKYPEMNDKEF